MKKRTIFNSLIIALVLGMNFSVTLAHADDASAPNVVAPAQPAAAQNTNPAATTTATTGLAATPPQASSPLQMALPFIVMLGVMYFLMIRPQQKRTKEHQSLMTTLKTGDEIVTSAGIIGTITGMSEKVVTLEVSKNVQLKVLRSQVNQIVKGQIQDIQPTA